MKRSINDALDLQKKQKKMKNSKKHEKNRFFKASFIDLFKNTLKQPFFDPKMLHKSRLAFERKRASED